MAKARSAPVSTATTTIEDLQSQAAAAREAADAAEQARVAANDEARALSAVATQLENQLYWETWKKIQEDAGHTVEGDSFATARVVELPEGPTITDTPGA
jgi:hypothetical protein